MRILITAILILIFAGAANSKESFMEITLSAEFASFNKVYDPVEYRDEWTTSFPVKMSSVGGELRYFTGDGLTVGGGVASSTIAGGRKWNLNHYEYQPYTVITMPYFFTGFNSRWCAFDIGLSYYISFEKKDLEIYYNPDGSESVKRQGGLNIERTRSYTFINLFARILREDKVHIRIRIGRERFSIIDSLFNAALVIPFKNQRWEIYVSIPTHISSYMPVSNQRSGLAFSYRFSRFILGVNTGYLTYNRRGGGSAHMSIFDRHRFSVGFTFGVLI